MIKYVVGYLGAGLAFALIDAVWLTMVGPKLYRPTLDPVLADQVDEDFLDALAIMPDASGIALGFDRLVMLATGAVRIDQVMWAPVAETAP